MSTRLGAVSAARGEFGSAGLEPHPQVIGVRDAFQRALGSRLRNLLNPFFTPRAADRWRPVMRGLLEEFFARVQADARMEFVGAFAKPYPSNVIATVRPLIGSRVFVMA